MWAEPLATGLRFETHRFNSHAALIHKDEQKAAEKEREKKNKVFKIIHKIKEEGPYSVYRVKIKHFGAGYVKILKFNNERAKLFLADEIKAQKKSKKPEDSAKMLDSGEDFILYSK